MTSPWDLYDQLIDEIPADITVTQILTDGKWRRVASSEDGVGMAFGMNVQPRPRATEDPSDLVGRPLRDRLRGIQNDKLHDDVLSDITTGCTACTDL